MSNTAHGLMEDIGGEIGFTAATKLVAWFGGGNLYVPITAEEGHPICNVIGFPAYRRLVAMFKDHDARERNIWIESSHALNVQRIARNKTIAELLDGGMGVLEVANTTGLDARRVYYVRAELEESRVVEVLREQRETLKTMQRIDVAVSARVGSPPTLKKPLLSLPAKSGKKR